MSTMQFDMREEENNHMLWHVIIQFFIVTWILDLRTPLHLSSQNKAYEVVMNPSMGRQCSQTTTSIQLLWAIVFSYELFYSNGVTFGTWRFFLPETRSEHHSLVVKIHSEIIEIVDRTTISLNDRCLRIKYLFAILWTKDSESLIKFLLYRKRSI